MGQFIVDPSFWDLFPQARIGVLLIRKFNNLETSPQAIVSLLEESIPIAQSYLTEEVFSDNAVIQTYRKAYQAFKTKKGARSSIEALLKRASGGTPIRSVNPLVDIYNAASLRYALPVGAEDMDRFVGDLQLTITDGGDEFYLIGDDRNQPTLPGELCYKDDVGAVCRCFNWRDGERTMITNQTQNAFLVIELLDDSREQAFLEALDFIQQAATLHLGASVEQRIITLQEPRITIN